MTTKVIKVERSIKKENESLRSEQPEADRKIFEWYQNIISVQNTTFITFSLLIEELNEIGLALEADSKIFSLARRRDEDSDLRAPITLSNSFLSLILLIHTTAGEVTSYMDEIPKNK